MRRERMWLPVERKLVITGLVAIISILSSCLWVACPWLQLDGQLALMIDTSSGHTRLAHLIIAHESV